MHQTNEQTEKLASIEIDVAKLKNEVKATFSNIHEKLDQQDSLRKKMDAKLDAIATQSRMNFDKFDSHTRDEMEKYEQIRVALVGIQETINKLSEDTAKNSGYIASDKENKRVDRLVSERLEEAKRIQDEKNATRNAVKNKIILTAVGLVTTVVVGGVISIVWFGFKAYMKLQLGE